MTQAFYVSLALWSQVVGSLLFIVALVFVSVRVVMPAIVRSQERKNAELAETELRRDRAKTEIEDARREVEAADADVQAIAERADSDARHLHERLIAAATAEGRRLVRDAEGELQRDRSAARDRLREELILKALGIARSAGSYLDEPTDRRLIGETVAAIDASEAAR